MERNTILKIIKTVVIVILLILAVHIYAESVPVLRQTSVESPDELIHPQTDPDARYTLNRWNKYEILLNVNGETFTIQSAFSMPNGTWYPNSDSSGFFDHIRDVIPMNGYLKVTDKFTNRTNQYLPIKQRHSVNLAGRLKSYWLAGNTTIIDSRNPQNPTSYATTANSGIGFMALNDEMQVHTWNRYRNDTLYLWDEECVLGPGAAYSAEWVIVPTQRPDFWDFVNACRRIRGVNFSQTGSFAFLPVSSTPGWSDEDFINFIRNKSADVVSSVGSDSGSNTDFRVKDKTAFRNHHDRVRRLFPKVKPVVYFHPYTDHMDYLNNFPDSVIKDKLGLPVIVVGRENTRWFFPTQTNSFGTALAVNVEQMFNDSENPSLYCNASGVYMDEVNAYRTETKNHYGDLINPNTGEREDWDGISGDINSDGSLGSLKSVVILLSQGWLTDRMNEIKMKGGEVICNGAPWTRTLADLKFQTFSETGYGGAARCLRQLLHSPIGMGSNTIEQTEINAYREMHEFLNYGCLYYWYSYILRPTKQSLTQYMFPITPIELHEGYIIGEERIVTNRSGTYGWGDKSVHEVHVFDDTGKEVAGMCEKWSGKSTVKVGDNNYTRLVLPEYYTAAIIRLPEGFRGCTSPAPWLNLLLNAD